jgi:hypothetical protein
MPPFDTTVRLLPEHLDISFVLTASGLGALFFTLAGTLRGFDPERLRRVALLGSLVGGIGGVGCLVLALTGLIR